MKLRRIQVNCSPELFSVLSELSDFYSISIGTLTSQFLSDGTSYFSKLLQELRLVDSQKSSFFSAMGNTIFVIHSQSIPISKIRKKRKIT